VRGPMGTPEYHEGHEGPKNTKRLGKGPTSRDVACPGSRSPHAPFCRLSLRVLRSFVPFVVIRNRKLTTPHPRRHSRDRHDVAA
jgi:hypothetical protein